MSNLNLSDEMLQQMIAKSIVDSLTPERRGELITNAIAALLAPQKDHYGRPQSTQLQTAFNAAVYRVAERVATEQLENDPAFKAQIEKLFADASAALFASDLRGKVVENLSDAIRRGLENNR